jgi:hypothetical protein
MFILMRRISAYTSPDVLLGVFTTDTEAEAAKAHYARVRSGDPAADPWKDQGYKPDMEVSQDLEIEQLPGEFPVGAMVWVVSNHSDGFGQEIRKLDSLHGSAEAAERRVDALDAIDDPEDMFPHYAVLDPVVVGSLHSDRSEDQPQPGWRQAPNQTRGARRLFQDVA